MLHTMLYYNFFKALSLTMWLNGARRMYYVFGLQIYNARFIFVALNCLHPFPFIPKSSPLCEEADFFLSLSRKGIKSWKTETIFHWVNDQEIGELELECHVFLLQHLLLLGSKLLHDRAILKDENVLQPRCSIAAMRLPCVAHECLTTVAKEVHSVLLMETEIATVGCGLPCWTVQA